MKHTYRNDKFMVQDYFDEKAEQRIEKYQGITMVATAIIVAAIIIWFFSTHAFR